MAGTAITYNSFDMNSSSVITSELDDASAPERNLPVYNLARSGGGVITDSVYYTKGISVAGKIVGTSMANLESLIDTFLAAFAVENKNLDIAYNSTTRRYVCTAAAVKISRPVRAANWAAFEVQFIATEYGKDTSTTTLVSAATHTTATSSPSLALVGSAPDQKLLVSITVTAATGLTNKSIQFKNNTTGEEVIITRTWIVGDVLVIDMALKTVKVNGVDVEFTGALPLFPPSTTTAVITNNFTTRTLTVTISYVKRYL